MSHGICVYMRAHIYVYTCVGNQQKRIRVSTYAYPSMSFTRAYLWYTFFFSRQLFSH